MPVFCTVFSGWRELLYDGEYDFDLSQYMVVLEQPLGVSLAPNLAGKVGQLFQELRPALGSQRHLMYGSLHIAVESILTLWYAYPNRCCSPAWSSRWP